MDFEPFSIVGICTWYRVTGRETENIHSFPEGTDFHLNYSLCTALIISLFAVID